MKKLGIVILGMLIVSFLYSIVDQLLKYNSSYDIVSFFVSLSVLAVFLIVFIFLEIKLIKSIREI